VTGRQTRPARKTRGPGAGQREGQTDRPGRKREEKKVREKLRGGQMCEKRSRKQRKRQRQRERDREREGEGKTDLETERDEGAERRHARRQGNSREGQSEKRRDAGRSGSEKEERQRRDCAVPGAAGPDPRPDC
jgi:hypothetical protein